MFLITLSNVLITIFYILPGYILCKCRKAVADHMSTMSAFLVYVCSPCMVMSSFLSLDFSLEFIGRMGLFFLITLFLQTAFLLLLFLIFRKKTGEAKYRYLAVGSALGNVGFFGLPIIQALMPDHPEVTCYTAMYMVSLNILIFTAGAFGVTGEKKFISLRSALTCPVAITCFIALPLYVLGARAVIPTVVLDAVGLLGKMTTPMCMMILGVRLGMVPLKQLFFSPVPYLCCIGKLILFPLFSYAIVSFLPLDFAFKAAILVLSSTPCASVVFNLAEMYHSETDLAANCVLLSTLLCFLTIPTLTLLL